MQFDDPKSGDGFVQIIRNTQAKKDSFTVYPFVEQDAVYHFTDSVHGNSFTISGAALKNGFTVQIPRRRDVLWFYRKDCE